ncbi:sodium:solute symporter family protein [Bacillus sp. DTU_2020_1000418_1_SI_GHA_SEK_038]|uniref:sodium:solute symporter family protein n=1 Tax=Bacillus sp. DTU_2020_1000418_1_SI_GHA_SEK_038 TaxID=3077585 RepID=UPI0028F01A9C|nr:sodium:solute symporter family protein [Bacillus sp. DTU_2020_1000418_1_SI_GHA_SEK_038]WNS76649.1 sodium:solute symporter family protein [Bacillus sp. DTU_2020_1000418_1_SI_GHA_SEK_038]
MDQSSIAILFIGASMFIPLWIGAKAGEKDQATISGFFVQNRSMSPMTVFFTVQATWWSAFAFLGSTSYYYNNGPVYWTTIGWDILFGILFLRIGKRIWFYGKENNYITATDFFMDIYKSKALGILVTTLMMLFTIPYFQIQISGGAYLIETASKGLIPSQMGAFVFTSVIVIYVWTGGLRAVAWTDIFYQILIIISVLLGGIFIVYYFNGIGNLFSELNDKVPEVLTLPGPMGPLLWISMFVIVPIGALMGPPLWIRIYAVKDAKTFYLIPFLLASISFINMTPMLLGNAGILLVDELVDSDTLLPRVVLNYMPYILAYIILIGGAAAAMSTANSQIHSISAMYTIDIHKRYINRNTSDKRLLNIGKVGILIFAVLSYLTFTFIPGLMIQLGLIALSGTAQVFVPVAGALFWEESNAKGAIAGIITGLAVLIIISYNFDINVGIIGFLALIFNAFVFIVVSKFSQEVKETKESIKNLKSKYKRSIN